METISLFSYKGGVGRTYLTVQLARCLAALGKKVIVADFDFDAPSIPGSFSEKPNFYKEISGGLYELVNQFINVKPRRDAKTTGGKNKYREFVDKLNKYLITVDVALNGTQNDEATLDKDSGWIKVLPGGLVDRFEYWADISSPEWVGLVRGKKGRYSIGEFIVETLQPALEDIGADYLLIDTRAGVTHYFGLVRGFSQRMVMIYTPTDETRTVMGKYLLPELKTHVSENSSQKWESFVLVAGRLPNEFMDKEEELYNDVIKFFINNMTPEMSDLAKLLKLSSDIKTYYDPSARVFDGRYSEEKNILSDNEDYQIVDLHLDILRVLAALLPEIAEEAFRKFSDDLGIPDEKDMKIPSICKEDKRAL